MRIKNLFLEGKMNKDVDERLLKNGEYKHAENIKVSNSEGSNAGAIENVLGNEKLSSINFGTNAFSIGIYSETFSDSIYWFVVSDLGSYICEYNETTNETDIILEDTRVGAENILNLSVDYLITGVNIVINSNNDSRYLLWTDDLNPPRIINIGRARAYGANNFDKYDINLVKAPPLTAPLIELVDTGDKENNIEEKFLQFSYRFRYLDGEKSALAPFSNVAFEAKDFQYDYTTGVNKSMVNAYNKVNITLDTGSKLVTDVEIVFKESGGNAVYLVETLNKENKGWGNSVPEVYSFTNNKIYKVLPEKELYRIYDNVPLKAKALSILNNRLIFGNYIENYNIEDCDGTPININLLLEKVSTPIFTGTAKESLKTNRDYEVGIAYLDDYGRLTTTLISENNTVYIPNSDSINQNQLKVTVKNEPPCFAKYYRFFIKQNRGDYETIIPNLFYQDGIYTWVRADKKDVNKIKEGETLVIKADTTGVISDLKYTEILEIKEQERNFLEDSSVTDLIQEAGLYYKLYADNFNLQFGEKNIHLSITHDESYKRGDFIINEDNYIEPAIFYGTSGQDDLEAGGIYAPVDNSDKRIHIRIFNLGDNITTWNTYEFSLDNGTNWDDNTGVGYIITVATPQAIADGLTIEFASNWGHEETDYWVISCKDKDDDGFLGGSYETKAYGVYEGVEGDIIYGNAAISFYYKERGDGNAQTIEESFTANSTYSNIEEWWVGDDIKPNIPVNATDIWFRRGYIVQTSTDELTFYQDITKPVCMIIRSESTQNTGLDEVAKINTRFDVKQLSDPLIFETKPIDFNSDIYYEIGKTYNITDGYHEGSDQNQTALLDAVTTLNTFNCFSFGNGFESYKIKDNFNAKTMNFDTRPSSTIENYKENKMIASLTYSEVFEQSTNYNGLNVFNLSKIPYKDLDSKYGSIQKLHAKDTDLTVYQEDKVHRVLYQKDVLYDADGSGNIRQSENILGQEVAYTGEFGISTSPESHAVYGNSEFFTDSKRGVLLRKSLEGIEDISRYGLEDWFRDYFRLNPNIRRTGAYDFYNGQYTLLVDDKVIVYDEGVKGFTSFFTYTPESMINLNNNFYSIKEGQIYLHNSEEVAHNTFYNEQSPSRVSLIVNESPSDVKELHALSLEGSDSWNALITAYVSTVGDDIQSSISDVEFFKKEGMWYAYARRNEDETQLDSKSTYGIGEVIGVGTDSILVNGSSSLLTTNDRILKDDLSTVGEVVTSSTVDGFTTIALTSLGTIANGDFIFGMKNSRVEGGNLRGYSMRIDLDITRDNKIELFAVNSEVVKSFS